MLAIVDSLKDNLKFLNDQPISIFADFCKLAWSFLNKGANLKLYQTASQKLEVDAKQIQAGVEGLAFLFIEATKYNLNEEGLKEVIVNLGLPENAFPVIYEEYVSQKTSLEAALPQAGIQHPQFMDLEWRFEIQTSSRALRKQMTPKITLKLDLEKRGNTESICLQSDIPNIIHTSQVINQALQECKTHHSKRIQRAVQ